MNLSVDGLVSGLDTTNLISQLMQVERAPQQRLVTQKSDVQKAIDVYRSLNTRFQAIETAADALDAPLSWLSARATSSNEAIATVTSASTASPASLTFEVTKLARAHALKTADVAVDPAQAGTIAGPIEVTSGATTVTVTDVGDGSLNAVAAAINASAAGVTATVIGLAGGTYTVQLSARSTGAASAFTVTGFESLGAGGVLVQGADAEITVGDPLDPTGHYVATSSTGVFDDILSGTTITAKSLGTTTVNVAPDPVALAEKVAKLITAVNDASTSILSQSRFDPATKKSGPLLADQAVLALQRKLTNAIIDAVGGSALTSGDAGISLDKSGSITFDKDKFITAYGADPSGIAALFQKGTADAADDGIAERLRLVAKNATDVVTGTLTSSINSRTERIKALDAAISAWDTRLAVKQSALKRQFAGLETALSKLRNQSTWLAGQLTGLLAQQASS